MFGKRNVFTNYVDENYVLVITFMHVVSLISLIFEIYVSK